MSASVIDTNDDWEEIWNARLGALSGVLCEGPGQVLHASYPFALGGQADVGVYFHHLDGVVYVTTELSSKPVSTYADYELMICHRAAQDWGPNAISRLAPYTQKTYLGSGETRDIGSATPPGSSIKAFLFDTYAKYSLFGQEFGPRLCVGITELELEFKMEHGSDMLLDLLKLYDVYPFTDLDRKSVPLIGPTLDVD